MAKRAPNMSLAQRFAAARGTMRDPGIDAPPGKGAPPAVYPIAVQNRPNQLAPAPLADRFPLIIGRQITLQYVSSVFRLCTTGYRMQYVDLLNELLEQDPHLFSVVQKRILASANGRLEITPFECEEGSSDDKLAKKAADMVTREIARIPDLSQSIAALLWAVYYGLSAAEIFWTRDADGWHVDRLGFIHSRRLSYPDGQSWAVHVWDQGQVLGWNQPWGTSPTNSGTFGLRIADWPGKFIVHAPQLRGDYPTRDGIGREIATWAIFKRVGASGAVDYLERFSKPIFDVKFKTAYDDEHPDIPREATPEDIELAAVIAASIGPGSGSFASHADSITIEPKPADGQAGGSKLTWAEWISICNSEMSKAALGGTLGTEVSSTGGNRSLGEVQERGEVGLEQYDGTSLAETMRRDLVTWLVRLNMPEALHVVPRCNLHVDEDPEPKTILELAAKATDIGAPVDLDQLAEDIGIPLVPNEAKGPDGKTKPRRSYKSDVVDPHTVDDSLMSEESKATAEEDRQNKQTVEMTKAQQPKVNPFGGPAGAPPGQAPGQTPSPGKGQPPAPGKKGQPKPGQKPAKGKGGKDQKGKRTLADKPCDAAICIVIDAVGHVLTVSRPEPPHEMAIPGGHVDEAEQPWEAAIRELREETGVEIRQLRMVGRFKGPDGIRVSCFRATEWQGSAFAKEPGTRIDWLHPHVLLEQSVIYRASVQRLFDRGAFARRSPDQDDDAHEMRDIVALLKDDNRKNVPTEVFDQLLEDYPAKTLHWVLAAHWEGPIEVPVDDLDFSNQERWRASHEPIQPYIDRMEAGKRKPVILVRTPDNPKLIIVDGHHRTLASKQMGIPVLAYVATVHNDSGPWDSLHSQQRKGSSKGSFRSFASFASFASFMEADTDGSFI